MEWIPSAAWLTKVAVDADAASLSYDLAIDASGRGRPVARSTPASTLPDARRRSSQLAREPGIDSGAPLLAVVLSLVGIAG